MLTTTQVRAIMHQFNRSTIYTNKTRKNPGAERRVKCYMPGDSQIANLLMRQLYAEAGSANVFVTPGAQHFLAGGPAITVKCVLA